MPFEKGKKKTGGKVKGSRNKNTLLLESFAQTVVDGGMERFQQELQKLEGKDYVNSFLQLFEYVKPKLSRMEMKAEVEAKVKKVGYGKEE